MESISLINYLNIKSKEAGHKLNMAELREIIKQDSEEYTRITDDLKVLYRKTFQYENMQKSIKDLHLIEN